MLSKTSDFFKNVREELKNVTWPERKDVNASTAVVITLVIVSAVYFWVIDSALAMIIRSMLR
jgi:preprotein translocase subunit SecE